jgi:23S rRNA pseudouridine2605 synthase
VTEIAAISERIAKRLARAGIASRREAERMIEAGRVTVDGKKITSPALNVTSANRITVDGKTISQAEETRLWRFHKPAGTITTAHDPQGRPGRLDFATEGLLLLTNDGELARYLELPQQAWLRRYRVRVHGMVSPEKLARLQKGITISGTNYGAIRAVLENRQASNAWIDVGIQEGKNREVRRVMEHLGLQVTRLIRVAFGPFQLGKLDPCMLEEVPPPILRQQMKVFFESRTK